MKRYFIFIVFFLLLSKTGVAQEAGKVRICLTYDISGKISKDEIDRFHDIILKVYNKRLDYYSYYDTISFLDIYTVRLEDSISFSRKIIENGVFLDYLIPVHTSVKWLIWREHGIRIKVKNMLFSQTTLYHNETPLLDFWMGEFLKLDDENNYGVLYSRLLQKVKEYNIISLYDLKDSSVECFIGINKDKDVFIIKVDYYHDTVSVIPAIEFTDDEFPHLFPDESNHFKTSKWK